MGIASNIPLPDWAKETAGESNTITNIRATR
jgi:hypothetical protein